MNPNVFQKLPGLITHSLGIQGVARRVRITLTAAQLKALFTTPITLIPAPGANRAIDVISITGKMFYGTAAFTGANAVEFRYTGAAGAKVTGDLAAAWLNNASTRVDKAIGAAVTMVENAPVVVAVPTANPAVGDGTVSLDILYRTVTITS